MKKILQLDPPIHLFIPDQNDFMLCWFLIDYHMEEHLYWVGPMEKTGEIWTVPNHRVRAIKNISIGRDFEPEQKDSSVSCA